MNNPTQDLLIEKLREHRAAIKELTEALIDTNKFNSRALRLAQSNINLGTNQMISVIEEAE